MLPPGGPSVAAPSPPAAAAGLQLPRGAAAGGGGAAPGGARCMAVVRAMGPERVRPEEPGPPEAPGDAASWSGDEEEDEEEEESGGGGYLYQPLSQDAEPGAGEQGPPADTGRGLAERLQALRLHLPEPPADSDEDEEAAEGAAARSSRGSIPMDAEHVELVKRTMAGVRLPSRGVPAWARALSEEQWQEAVRRALQARRGAEHT